MKLDVSTLFFFFKALLVLLEPLHIHINFRISLLISRKKHTKVWFGIALNLYISLKETNYLNKTVINKTTPCCYDIFSSFIYCWLNFLKICLIFLALWSLAILVHSFLFLYSLLAFDIKKILTARIVWVVVPSLHFTGRVHVELLLFLS